MEETNVQKKSYLWTIVKVVLAIAAVVAAAWYFAKRYFEKLEKESKGSDIDQYVAFMTGKNVAPKEGTFKGLTFRGFMSGCQIDLMNVEFEKESFVSIKGVMCGVDIKVPKDVKVVADGVIKAGSAMDKTDHEGDENKDKVLYVAYDATASGIVIRNGEDD